MKKNKGARRRLFIIFIILIILISLFCGGLYNYWDQIYANYQETKLLKNHYQDLLEEEVGLKEDIIKLQDPDYVARYAKENYLYSADGDTIIKIVK